jgi:hypothetical protein
MHRERTETEAEVLKVLADKQDSGFNKYNQGIDYRDDYDWLREAEEEMADGLQYIVAARMKREVAITMIDELIDDISDVCLDCGCFSYVIEELNKIKGIM